MDSVFLRNLLTVIAWSIYGCREHLTLKGDFICAE
jgi:hypothetical protein